MCSPAIANASINLDFSAPNQSANSIDIGIVVSGLGTGSAPSLGSYDVDIQFDSHHIAFSAAAFGDPVLGNQLDLFDFGLNESLASVSDAGVLNLFEISLDDDLNNFQANSFTLAVLTFDILTSDTSQLEFVINDFGDANDNLLSVNTGTATITTVPLPSALLLMVSGLGMLLKKTSRKL